MEASIYTVSVVFLSLSFLGIHGVIIIDSLLRNGVQFRNEIPFITKILMTIFSVIFLVSYIITSFNSLKK